ncbi:MAG TPA: phosphoadenylyl-sulfate reductase [Alphaproteobacteria bacterium]|nr:phosphoadenylyl-sulfate reductase [Alphaproteobacteria bacterium]
MAAAATITVPFRLTALQQDYALADTLALLRAMIQQEFAGRITVVSSFGAESAVLLHLVAQIDPSTPVLFLNTGKLFGETLRYRDRLQDLLGLTDLRAIGPHPKDRDALDPEGSLWSKNPDACCNFRKTMPLSRAMEGFDAWITGRKRFQTDDRADMEPIELVGARYRINPLADWRQADLDRYMIEHHLPAHPLVRDGYLSIGCMSCTSRVKKGEDPRAGRWRGQDKTECGIHLDSFTDGGGI